MAATRELVEATLEAGGPHAVILENLLETFPFHAPKSTIQSYRAEQAWSHHRTETRKLDKRDKMVQKRQGLYYGLMLSFLSKHCPDKEMNLELDMTTNTSHDALEKVYKEVTNPEDGAGKDLTVTKPYIQSLMTSPTAQDISDFTFFMQATLMHEWY